MGSLALRAAARPSLLSALTRAAPPRPSVCNRPTTTGVAFAVGIVSLMATAVSFALGLLFCGDALAPATQLPGIGLMALATLGFVATKVPAVEDWLDPIPPHLLLEVLHDLDLDAAAGLLAATAHPAQHPAAAAAAAAVGGSSGGGGHHLAEASPMLSFGGTVTTSALPLPPPYDDDGGGGGGGERNGGQLSDAALAAAEMSDGAEGGGGESPSLGGCGGASETMRMGPGLSVASALSGVSALSAFSQHDAPPDFAAARRTDPGPGGSGGGSGGGGSGGLLDPLLAPAPLLLAPSPLAALDPGSTALRRATSAK